MHFCSLVLCSSLLVSYSFSKKNWRTLVRPFVAAAGTPVRTSGHVCLGFQCLHLYAMFPACSELPRFNSGATSVDLLADSVASQALCPLIFQALVLLSFFVFIIPRLKQDPMDSPLRLRAVNF